MPSPFHRGLLGLAILLATAAASWPAAAQRSAPPASSAGSTSVRDVLSADARDEFDRGARLFKEGRVTEARDAFLAAYAQSKEPRVLYNVAVCDKELGRHARAIATLKKSLATADRPLPRDYIQRAAEALETLGRYVATVTVDTSTEGALVRLDGEIVRENPITVDAGSHVLTASKEGFETATATLSVKAGEAPRIALALLPSLSPGTAQLSCIGEPQCELSIGDEALGRGPVTVTRTTGSYLVRAFVGGRLWSERRVDIQNGQRLDVALVGRQASVARLRITTDQPDDTVSIDGSLGGRSGIESELAPGEHRVIIARPGGASKTLDVLLRENETRDLRVTLDEKKKGISAWWFVAGGVVLAGAATAAILIATQPKTFEGTGAGTLNPYVVPASTAAPGGLR